MNIHDKYKLKVSAQYIPLPNSNTESFLHQSLLASDIQAILWSTKNHFTVYHIT